MIGEKLYTLRKKAGLTQEEMAEKFNVSRQSVQKWETKNVMPDIDRLISIAKYFNVSLDELIDNKPQTANYARNVSEFIPDYEQIHGWELYSADIGVDYQQCLDEGIDVAQYKNLFDSIAVLKRSKEKETMADALFSLVSHTPYVASYKYTEPSDLEGIRSLRKNDLPQLKCPDITESKIAGAWYGRICGCLLGKPIECISYEELTYLLKKTNNYPMKRYILQSDITDEICQNVTFSLRNQCYADTVSFAPSDDDTNYTVMNSIIIDNYGVDFTPADVAHTWTNAQPKDAYCTAERVAYVNIVRGYYPPLSATYKNPYREWIGAQIRADYFGFINPGNPEKAAEMAWRDASVSHIKNGIYGEMVVAAMIAAAAAVDNIRDAVLYGIAEIPSTSRLYEALSNVVDCFDKGMSSDEWFENFHKRWNDRNSHHWCHTISNAEIVVASLLYGNGDYQNSVCLAVQNGFDTDCNGATVGAICGMFGGFEGIDPKWYEPINGKLNTSVYSLGVIEISKYIQRTLKHINASGKQ